MSGIRRKAVTLNETALCPQMTRSRHEKFGALPAGTLETPDVSYETHFTSGQCGGGFLLEEQRQIVPEQP